MLVFWGYYQFFLGFWLSLRELLGCVLIKYFCLLLNSQLQIFTSSITIINSMTKAQLDYSKLPLICLTFLIIISIVNCQVLETIGDASPCQKKIVEFPTFDQYVKDFKKQYSSPAEYAKREQIYNKRIQKLREMQNDPKIQFCVGVSQFTDQTDEERQKRKPLSVDQKSKAQAAQNPKKLSQATGIPSNLDWRNSGIITSIKNQGDCGACWTFATAAYGQSRMIKNGTRNKDIDLSQQYLLSCTSECSCDGGYLEYVFEKAAGGVPLESQYPYSPYTPTSPFICWSEGKTYFGYIPQKHYDLSDNQLKVLLQSGPVAISISATNWQDYSGGVYKCNPFDKVNHAVLLIGYTPSYWIIKNQWGEKWGQQGFIRVTSDPQYNCKIGTSAFVMWSNLHIFALYLVIALFLVF